MNAHPTTEALLESLDSGSIPPECAETISGRPAASTHPAAASCVHEAAVIVLKDQS